MNRQKMSFLCSFSEKRKVRYWKITGVSLTKTGVSLTKTGVRLTKTPVRWMKTAAGLTKTAAGLIKTHAGLIKTGVFGVGGSFLGWFAGGCFYW